MDMKCKQELHLVCYTEKIHFLPLSPTEDENILSEALMLRHIHVYVEKFQMLNHIFGWLHSNFQTDSKA
jgi:hypothetical protein